jgi:hypothetical protein
MEAHGFGMQTGKYRGHPAAGDTVRIRAEVVRQFGDTEAVRDGIGDALACRRPR